MSEYRRWTDRLPEKSFVGASKHRMPLTVAEIVAKAEARRFTHSNDPMWFQWLVAGVTVAVVTGIGLWIVSLCVDAFPWMK